MVALRAQIQESIYFSAGSLDARYIVTEYDVNAPGKNLYKLYASKSSFS